MSPVSHGRKPKKSKNKQRNAARSGAVAEGYVPSVQPERNTLDVLRAALGGPRERPDWFDPAIEAVLGATDPMMAATGPRQLEQIVTELIGAEFHRVVQAEQGLWFQWWLTELADAAADRAQKALADPDDHGWEAPWRVLHALTGLVADVTLGQTRLRQVSKAMPKSAAARQPDWLRLLPQQAATGAVWQLRDGYGARHAIIAGFSYPDGVDPSVFLLDVDTSGFTTLLSAGSYDDVTQAALAWRERVGEAAGEDAPTPVTDPGTLHALVNWDHGESFLRGDESRSYLDNWYRAPRRLRDLALVLRKRRTPLPAPGNLYRDRAGTVEPMIEAFTAWHAGRTGTAPDPEAVEALAYEWVEGTVPGTEHVASPERVRHVLALAGDWADQQITTAVRELIPDWVRWNAEQTGLPPHLRDRTLAATAAPAEDAAATHAAA